jgi:hypothetical protein
LRQIDPATVVDNAKIVAAATFVVELASKPTL